MEAKRCPDALCCAPNHQCRLTAVGIILSGGPWSIYEEGAPKLSPAVFELNVPILGICYGLQAISWHFARESVAAGQKKEYGKAQINIERHRGAAVHVDRLFNGLDSQLEVWMSHSKSDVGESYMCPS